MKRRFIIAHMRFDDQVLLVFIWILKPIDFASDVAHSRRDHLVNDVWSTSDVYLQWTLVISPRWILIGLVPATCQDLHKR